MADYIPPSLDWVREQVELYEGSGGTEGVDLLDTGMPCIIVTHTGNRTGGIRKIPLMRVKVDEGYVLVGSMGGQPKNPAWIGSGRRTSLFGKPNLVVQQNRRGTTVHQSQRGAVFNER